jgi:hypothetical protein
MEPLQDGADVVGQRVGGGDDLVAGLDFDGVVEAQAGDELLDGPVGALLEPVGDGEGGEHDGEVGLDRVALAEASLQLRVRVWNHSEQPIFRTSLHGTEPEGSIRLSVQADVV